MILAAMYAEQQENSNHLLPPKCNSLMLYTPKLQYFKLATIHVMLKKHLNYRQKSAKSLFGIETSQQQRH